MKKILNYLYTSIYPQSCLLCKKIIEIESHFCHECWNQLDFITAPYCEKCGLPLAHLQSFNPEDIPYCNACLQDPPHFEKARAALIYNPSLQKLIVGFKQHDQTASLAVFTDWLFKLTMLFNDTLSDHICLPVPIHYFKMFHRHYNQAALLAHALAKRLTCQYWPNALIRIKHTKPQGTVFARDRKKNIKNAFKINPKFKVKIQNKKLILVDDVYTSGSTAKECTKICLNAGAKTVKILTIARTVKHL